MLTLGSVGSGGGGEVVGRAGRAEPDRARALCQTVCTYHLTPSQHGPSSTRSASE